MDAMAGFWGWGVVLIGGFFLGAVILWSLLKNRRSTPEDIAGTERATRQNYVDQDAADKRDNQTPAN